MATWCVGIAVFSQKASSKGIQYKPVKSGEWLQRWADILRLGPTPTPWTTWPTQSRECQPLPKMRVPSGHSPPELGSTNNPDGSSVLPSPRSQTRAGSACRQSRPWPPGAGSQEHPEEGQQDGDGQSGRGCWTQQQQEVMPQQGSNPSSPTLHCLSKIALGWRMLSLRGMHSCWRGHATKELPRGHQLPAFLGLCASTAHAGCTGLSPLSLMLCCCSGQNSAVKTWGWFESLGTASATVLPWIVFCWDRQSSQGSYTFTSKCWDQTRTKIFHKEFT